MWQTDNRPRGRKTGTGHASNGEEGRGRSHEARRPGGDCSQERPSGKERRARDDLLGLGKVTARYLTDLLSDCLLKKH